MIIPVNNASSCEAGVCGLSVPLAVLTMKATYEIFSHAQSVDPPTKGDVLD